MLVKDAGDWGGGRGGWRSRWGIPGEDVLVLRCFYWFLRHALGSGIVLGAMGYFCRVKTPGPLVQILDH